MRTIPCPESSRDSSGMSIKVCFMGALREYALDYKSRLRGAASSAARAGPAPLALSIHRHHRQLKGFDPFSRVTGRLRNRIVAVNTLGNRAEGRLNLRP